MNDIIKSALPWLATALGGPLAGVAADFVGDKLGMSKATVDTVKSVLNGMSPEKVAELQAADNDFKLKMIQMGYDSTYRIEQLNINAATQNASDVNKTMQTEATSEHWPTYSWRPAIGFAVAWNLIAGSLIVLIAYLWRTELVPKIPEMLTALAGLNAVAMPILGIASWFRGKAQADPMVATPIVTQKG